MSSRCLHVCDCHVQFGFEPFDNCGEIGLTEQHLKFNAARRVRNVLEKARAYGDNQKTYEVWDGVFGTQHLTRSAFENTRLLHLLHEQVDTVQHDISRAGFDVEDYTPVIREIRKVITVPNFGAEWRVYKASITPEVIRQLGLFAQSLSTDEARIPNGDIARILRVTKRYYQELSAEEFDPRLKRFLQRQSNNVEQALREYPIRGDEAVKDGDARIFGEAVADAPLLTEYEAEERVSRADRIWRLLKKLKPSVVINISPAQVLSGDTVQKALEVAEKNLDNLH